MRRYKCFCFIRNDYIMKYKCSTIDEINGKHQGGTLFLVGSGPSLNKLNSKHIKYLDNCITLGVNRVQYKINLKYFISAYASELLLFLKYANVDSQAFHMRPSIDKSIDGRIIQLKRKFYDFGEILPRYLDSSEPTLITRNNVMFGALSLATIMQPKRIILIGFEQKDNTHFYQLDDDIRKKIFYDFIELYNNNPESINLDKKQHSIYMVMKNLLQDAEFLSQKSFYKINHTRLLSVFLNQIKDYGIEVYTTIKDSIGADAGALYMPLDNFIYNNLNNNSSKVFKKKRIYNIKYIYDDLRMKYNIKYLKSTSKRFLPNKLIQFIKQYK